MAMPHSSVHIPVPDLEPVVRPRLERSRPDAVPADADDTVAHITLLGPFADLTGLTDGVLDELGRFFADVTPFDFQLTGIHRFPGGTVYLSPSPAAPFRQLTHELSRLFPEHPPYGGAFDDVVPHLSVPTPDGEEATALEFELGSRFPISTYAREAVLFWWEPGASRTIATFPFGTSAA
jgi:hypothetical protein